MFWSLFRYIRGANYQGMLTITRMAFMLRVLGFSGVSPLMHNCDFTILSRTSIFIKNKGPQPEMTFQYEFQPFDIIM